jgi:hypothetical protein
VRVLDTPAHHYRCRHRVEIDRRACSPVLRPATCPAGTAVPWRGARPFRSGSPDQGPDYRVRKCADIWLRNASPVRAAWTGWTSAGAARRAVRDSGWGVSVVLGDGGAPGQGARCDRTIVAASAAESRSVASARGRRAARGTATGRSAVRGHLAISPRAVASRHQDHTESRGRPR